MSVNQFFKNIYHDLYYDVYKAVGGSLEDEAVNWPLYLSKLASTGIKSWCCWQFWAWSIG